MDRYTAATVAATNATERVWFLLAACEAHDVTARLADVDDSDLLAESGIVTDRDADAIWALQQDAEDDAEDEREAWRHSAAAEREAERMLGYCH